MDLAAQRVHSLAQRILPERPHHLALLPDGKYSVPPDFWQHHSHLQYSTFLSDTDRGILLTRPYYEIIREEPDQLSRSPAIPASKPEAKKAVTKMSFKDYQNSKKKLSSSSPDSAPQPRQDAKQAGAEGPRQAKLPIPKPVDGKRKVSDVSASAGSTPKDDLIKRPRVPSREPPRNGVSPSPHNGRRSPDFPDSARPLKKIRMADGAKPDTLRTLRPDVSANKILPASTDRSGASRDVKSGGSALTNGRITSASSKAASPQRQPVNGPKSSSMVRSESSGKASVPPLLSPLRISIDDDHEVKAKGPAKRPVDAGTVPKVSGKGERAEGLAIKKPARPSLPPLLSPTLPDIVEQELARGETTSPKGDIESTKSRAIDSPSVGGKTVPKIEDEPEVAQLIVHLKYKKKNSLRVQRLLALQPASKIEALKKERSMSVEVNSPPAKKRPRVAEAAATEPVAGKRPRTSMDSIMVSKPVAPSTPLKTAATAMSRVPSTNSQAQTPGGAITKGLTPGPGDRPPTSYEFDPTKGMSSATLRRKGGEYTGLGTQLKHKRDGILNSVAGTNKAEVLGNMTSSDKKRVAALSLEMVLSYIVGFDAMNQSRSQDRKPGDYQLWESLIPHLGELRNFTRSYKALDGIAMQLHAIVVEELIRVYYHHDFTTVGTRIVRVGKKLHENWVEAHGCVSTITEPSMKADLGPWSRPSSAAAQALQVLHNWAQREVVDWRAQLSLKMSNGV
ncbi:hypothetical protein GGTG_11241 [Gaeumannomyces tritici R3-111a-1]|uniref:Uncharacterized protein n=1 Tax=Gaeumannomyces tritici (strain R3-111a-1) TaxID=644352 RepID=J3PCM1_GAET3|nr:hypothetical protein GGTG_11241 [Gaeumannomyces tritici R3-111a-1]EJT71991.1 hypothetical protein GGTG_11241 [Gaeumannomyces tritici R3-111a-1]